MKIIALSTLLALGTSPPMLAEGNAEEGERIFRKCASCHSIEEGGRKSGPSLFGIVGAQSGSVEGFRYSDANLSLNVVWDEENLAEFVADPRDFMPGTRMSFRGLRDEQDIENLITYLAQQN